MISWGQSDKVFPGVVGNDLLLEAQISFMQVEGDVGGGESYFEQERTA